MSGAVDDSTRGNVKPGEHVVIVAHFNLSAQLLNGLLGIYNQLFVKNRKYIGRQTAALIISKEKEVFQTPAGDKFLQLAPGMMQVLNFQFGSLGNAVLNFFRISI